MLDFLVRDAPLSHALPRVPRVCRRHQPGSPRKGECTIATTDSPTHNTKRTAYQKRAIRPKHVAISSACLNAQIGRYSWKTPSEIHAPLMVTCLDRSAVPACAAGVSRHDGAAARRLCLSRTRMAASVTVGRRYAGVAGHILSHWLTYILVAAHRDHGLTEAWS